MNDERTNSAAIARIFWKSLYEVDAAAGGLETSAEFRHNAWMVSGVTSSERLHAFILQFDGRILSIGREPIVG